MPNYKYTCIVCDKTWLQTLPISFNPKDRVGCPVKICHGSGQRKIIGANSIKMGKETLGDWYKKKTGKELLGG